MADRESVNTIFQKAIEDDIGLGLTMSALALIISTRGDHALEMALALGFMKMSDILMKILLDGTEEL